VTIENCILCPRLCGVKRTAEAGNGVCGMGTLPVIANAAPHFGEEPCVSGTRGSGAVFFRGCGLFYFSFSLFYLSFGLFDRSFSFF